MSSQYFQIRLNVPKAIDPEAREVARAQAQEALVLSLWIDAQLTSEEAAREVGLSSKEFDDWFLGAKVSLRSAALRQKRLEKLLPKVEVQQRDLSYYNFLTPRDTPETDPTAQDH